MVDIFMDADGNEIFRVEDSGEMIFLDKKKEEKKCEHRYSRSMDQPYPRACTLCGKKEDARKS